MSCAREEAGEVHSLGYSDTNNQRQLTIFLTEKPIRLLGSIFLLILLLPPQINQ